MLEGDSNFGVPGEYINCYPDEIISIIYQKDCP
jgi:hypothetical protein